MTTRTEFPAWVEAGARVALVTRSSGGRPDYAEIDKVNPVTVVIGGLQFRYKPGDDELVYVSRGAYGNVVRARPVDDPRVVRAEELADHADNAHAIEDAARDWAKSRGPNHRGVGQATEIEEGVRGVLVAAIVRAGLASEVALAAGLGFVGAPVPLRAVDDVDPADG